MIGIDNTIEGGATKKFRNRNRIYVELLDERGNSHNYFQQFGPSANFDDLRVEWNTNPSIKVNESSKNYDGSGERFFPVWVVGSGYSSFPQDQHVDPDDCVTLDLEFKKTQDFGACYSAFVHSGRFQRINDAAHHAMEDSNSSFTFSASVPTYF